MINQIYIVELKVLKREDIQATLIQKLEELKFLVKQKSMEFNTNTNPNKYAACAVSKYCGHKASQSSKLDFPYDKRLKS